MTLAAAALLLSTFPAALGIVLAAIAVETRYTVVVHNCFAEPLSEVGVYGGGCEARFGAIPPGGTAKRSFWIQCDGQLELRARRGSTPCAWVIDSYVTNDMGGRSTVTVGADGGFSVEHALE